MIIRIIYFKVIIISVGFIYEFRVYVENVVGVGKFSYVFELVLVIDVCGMYLLWERWFQLFKNVNFIFIK